MSFVLIDFKIAYCFLSFRIRLRFKKFWSLRIGLGVMKSLFMILLLLLYVFKSLEILLFLFFLFWSVLVSCVSYCLKLYANVILLMILSVICWELMLMLIFIGLFGFIVVVDVYVLYMYVMRFFIVDENWFSENELMNGFWYINLWLWLYCLLFLVMFLFWIMYWKVFGSICNL